MKTNFFSIAFALLTISFCASCQSSKQDFAQLQAREQQIKDSLEETERAKDESLKQFELWKLQEEKFYGSMYRKALIAHAESRKFSLFVRDLRANLVQHVDRIPVQLADTLSLSLIRHRDEVSETGAYLFDGDKSKIELLKKKFLALQDTLATLTNGARLPVKIEPYSSSTWGKDRFGGLTLGEAIVELDALQLEAEIAAQKSFARYVEEIKAMKR